MSIKHLLYHNPFTQFSDNPLSLQYSISSSPTTLPTDPQTDNNEISNQNDDQPHAPFKHLFEKQNQSIFARPKKSFFESLSYATFVGSTQLSDGALFGGIGGASAGLLDSITEIQSAKTSTPNLYSFSDHSQKLWKYPTSGFLIGSISGGTYFFLTKTGITLLNETNTFESKYRKMSVGLATGVLAAIPLAITLSKQQRPLIPLLFVPVISALFTHEAF